MKKVGGSLTSSDYSWLLEIYEWRNWTARQGRKISFKAKLVAKVIFESDRRPALLMLLKKTNDCCNVKQCRFMGLVVKFFLFQNRCWGRTGGHFLIIRQ